MRRREADPAEGLPLEEALRRWCDREAVAELERLESQGYGGPMIVIIDAPETPEERAEWRHRELRARLEAELIELLRRGGLAAEGYDSRDRLDARPVVIPAGRWHILEPDFERSSAKGSGFTIEGIFVFDPGRKAEQRQTRCPGPVVPEQTFEDWYLERVEDCLAAGVMPSRGDDFKAADTVFPGRVTHEMVRKARRKHAPEAWKKQGRRKPSR